MCSHLQLCYLWARWMVSGCVPAHVVGGFLEQRLCGSSLATFLDFKFWVRALTVTEKHCKALLSGSWWNQSRNHWKWIVLFFFNPRFILSALLFQEIGCTPCVCAWSQDSELVPWYIKGCINITKNHFVVFFCLVTQGDNQALFRSSSTEHHLASLGQRSQQVLLCPCV